MDIELRNTGQQGFDSAQPDMGAAMGGLLSVWLMNWLVDFEVVKNSTLRRDE